MTMMNSQRGTSNLIKSMIHLALLLLLLVGVHSGMSIQAQGTSLPEADFYAADATVTESNSAVQITVTLSEPANSTVRVNYSLGGTATVGQDYEPATGFLTFAPQTVAQDIVITLKNDDVQEDDEDIEIQLTSAVGATVAPGNSFIVTIKDDDIPLVSFGETSKEAVENAGTVTIPIKLNKTNTKMVTAHYSVGGSATSGLDYETLSGEAVFPANEPNQLIAVKLLDDTEAEATETVELTLDAVEGAELGTPLKATVRILDNEPPAVSFVIPPRTENDTDPRRVVEKAVEVPIQVQLSRPATQAITVAFELAGTAKRAEDYQVPEPLSVTFATGATVAQIPVSIIDDSLLEDDETIILRLKPDGVAACDGVNLATTLTIVDNEVPTIEFLGRETNVQEGGLDSVMLTVSQAPKEAITVKYVVDGSAESGKDFQPLIGTVTFKKGEMGATIPIQTIDDQEREGPEYFQITLTEIPAKNGNIGVQDRYTVNIIDNDQYQPLTLSPAGANSSQPDLCIDAQGNTHVVWRNVADQALWYAKVNDKNEIVIPARKIYEANKVYYPRAAVDPKGDVHVVFQSSLSALTPNSSSFTGAAMLNYVRITSGTLSLQRAFTILPTWKFNAYNTPAIEINKDGYPVVAAEFHACNEYAFDSALSKGLDGIAIGTLRPDHNADHFVENAWQAFRHESGWGKGYPTDVDAVRPELAVDLSGRVHCVWRHKNVKAGWAGTSVGYNCDAVDGAGQHTEWREISSRNLIKDGGPMIGQGIYGRAEVVWCTTGNALLHQQVNAFGALLGEPELVSDVQARPKWPDVVGGFGKLVYSWVDYRTTGTLQKGPMNVLSLNNEKAYSPINVSESPAGANYARLAARSKNSVDYIWVDGRSGTNMIAYRTWNSGGTVQANQDYDHALQSLVVNAKIYDPNYGEIKNTDSKVQWKLIDAAGKIIAGPETMRFDRTSGLWRGQKGIKDLQPGYYRLDYQADYTLPNGTRMSADGRGGLVMSPVITIKGTVMCKTNGKPAAQASVSVGLSKEKLYYSTVTDSQGQYEIKNVASHKVKIAVAELAGYAGDKKGLRFGPNDVLVTQELTLGDKTDKPLVTGVMFKWFGIFLADLDAFLNDYTVFVNWPEGADPGKVQLYVDGESEPRMSRDADENGAVFNDVKLTQLFDFGSTYLPGVTTHKLIFVASDKSGKVSERYEEPIRVITTPAYLPLKTLGFVMDVGIFNNDPTLNWSWKFYESSIVQALPLVSNFTNRFALEGSVQYKLVSGEWEFAVGSKPIRKVATENGATASKPIFKWKLGEKTELELSGGGSTGGVLSPVNGWSWDKMTMFVAGAFKYEITKFNLVRQLPPQASSVVEVFEWLAKMVSGKNRVEVEKIFDSMKYVNLDGTLDITSKVDLRSPSKGMLSYPMAFEKWHIEWAPGIVASYNPTLNDQNKMESSVAGKITADTQIIPELSLDQVTGEIAAKLDLYVKNVHRGAYQVSLLNGVIYAKAAAASMMHPVAKDAFRLAPVKVISPAPDANWNPIARDYLKAWPSRFVANASAGANRLSPLNKFKALASLTRPSGTLNANATGVVDLTLQENIYPLSDLAMASHDGRHMVLFVADNGNTANLYQFTDIYWSEFDGSTWSTPKAILADQRGEFWPTVAYDGNGDAVAMWERIKDPAYQTPDIDGMSSRTEIVTATWDHATRAWTTPVELTNNTILDQSPRICGPLADGSLLAVWTENSHNLFVGRGPEGDAENSRVLWTRWDPATHLWKAAQTLIPNMSCRTSQSLAGAGQKAVYAFTRDNDYSLDSIQDQEVFYLVWNGAAWGAGTRLTTDDTADDLVHAAVGATGKVYLTWKAGDQLVMNRDLATTGTTQLAGDIGAYDLTHSAMTVSPTGNLALVWQDQTQGQLNAAFAAYDPASGRWSRPIPIFQGQAVEDSYAPSWDQAGNLTMAYKRSALNYTTQTLTVDGGRNVTFGNMPTRGRTDLGVVKKTLSTDLAVLNGDTTCTYHSLLPGEPITVKIHARNVGVLPVADPVVALFDGNPQAGGTELARQAIAGWFDGGAETDLTINWIMPTPAAAHILYTVIDPDNTVTETNDYNNMNFVRLGGTDLQPIGTNMPEVAADGSAQLLVQVGNAGGPAAEPSVLAIRAKGQAGAPLATVAVPRLDAGQTASVGLTLPVGTIPVGKTQSFIINTDDTGKVTDVDPGNDKLEVNLSSLTDGPAPTPTPPTILVDTDPVVVPESSTTSFKVSLSGPPAFDVTLKTEYVSGDSNLTVQSGSPVTIPKDRWNEPVTVTLAAAKDADAINGTAIFRIRDDSGAGIASKDLNAREQDSELPLIVTSMDAVTIPEGGATSFTVKLSALPPQDVTLKVERLSGDAGLTVQGAATITIPQNSWVSAQTVTLAAATDADSINGTAIFRISETSSNGIMTEEITATEIDNTGIKIVTNTDYIPIFEAGGDQQVWISLSAMPKNDATLKIEYLSGKTNVTVTAGSPVTITRGNWNQPVPFTLTAAAEADTVSANTVFRISETTGNGLAAKDITARELDKDGVINVGGAINADTAWTDTTKDYRITAPITIAAGKTLTIGLGVSVIQTNGSWRAFTVNGTLKASGCMMYLYTYRNWSEDNHVDGIQINAGGVGEFTGVRFLAFEQRGDVDFYNNGYWDSVIDAKDGSQLTVKGCAFESINNPTTARVYSGVMVAPGAIFKSLTNQAVTPAVPNTFRVMSVGIFINYSDSTTVKDIDVGNFDNCLRNLLVYGNVTGQYVLRNLGQTVHPNSNGLIVKSGGKLTFPVGSGLRAGDNSKRLSVEAGGAVEFSQARVELASEATIAGTLQMTDTTCTLHTYRNYYEQGSEQGFQIERTGAATFTRSRFICQDNRWDVDNGNFGYWSAGIYARSGSNLKVYGCAFESLDPGPQHRTTYGILTEPETIFEIDSATDVTPAVRTSFKNFTNGFYWQFGGAAQSAGRFDFSGNIYNVLLSGNAQSQYTLSNPGQTIHPAAGVAAMNVKTGGKMTFAPGSELRSVGDNRLIVEAGGEAAFNQAATDMACRITVNGRITATNTQFATHTYRYYYEARTNGIELNSGATGDFRNCDFHATDGWRDDNPGSLSYISMMIQALDGSQLKVVGSRFVADDALTNQKTTYGVYIAQNCKAEILSTTDTVPVRNSFKGFYIGINWQFGALSQVVDACDFDDCGYNMALLGDVTQPLVIRNPKSIIHWYPDQMVGGGWRRINIKKGGKLTFAPGSELCGWEPQRLTVEPGGALVFDQARTQISSTIVVQGTVQAKDSNFNVATYRHYDGNRTSGFEIRPGGAGTFQTCSFYTHETRDEANMKYWSAAIEVFGPDTANKLLAGKLSLDGCFLSNARTPYDYITPYGVIMRSNGPWSIVNSLFLGQYRGLLIDQANGGTEGIVQFNDFRNSTDNGVFISGGTVQDAELNYWGAATGPQHVTNPGGTGDRVTDYVNFGNNMIAPQRPLVVVADPLGGQLISQLSDQPLQYNVGLMGLRFTKGEAEIRRVSFFLSDPANGLTWDQLDNFRLIEDTNGDGKIMASETTGVGGVSEVIVEGGNRRIEFSIPFTSNPSSAVNYLLVADLRRLSAGQGFNIQLDDRFLETAPGVGIQRATSTARHLMGSMVLLANPLTGQKNDALNGLPTQKGVDLFGFRLAGAERDAQSLTLNLSDIQGFSAEMITNLRLVLDANQNGMAEPGETAVGGTPTLTISGATGSIVLSQPFKTGGSYVLAADLNNLVGGNRMTIGLTPDKIVLPNSELVSGAVNPVTHQVDYPVLLSRTTEWIQPDYFGKSENQTDMPILGFQIAPSGVEVKSLTLQLSNMMGMTSGDIRNLRLYWDKNNDSLVDENDVLLAGDGTVTFNGESGSIVFTTPFDTRGNMILVADFANLATGDEFTLSMQSSGLQLDGGMLASGVIPELRYTVGQGVASSSNKNMSWTLTYRSPGGFSNSGRFNHAGNLLIQGYDTGSAWIYDAKTNTPVIMLKDHYDSVKYAGFNSDDTAAVTVSRDGAVYIWDLQTSGTLRSAMFSDLLVDYAVPSPDFRKLMVVTQGKAVLLDIDTQQRLWEYIPGSAQVLSVAYSPDGSKIAIGQSDKRAYLLDAANGVVLQALSGQTQSVTTVGFTADGSRLMTSSTDGTVQIWQISPKKVLRTISLQNQAAQGAAFSNNGTRVAIVTGYNADAQLRMYDATSGLELFAININQTALSNWGGTLTNVTFDDAGERVLVNSTSNWGAFNAAFRVSDGSYLRSWGPVGRFSDPAAWASRPRISGDGERIFYQTNWGMNLLFRTLGKTIRRSPTFTAWRPFDISRDGAKLAWLTRESNGALHVESVSDTGFATTLNVNRGLYYYDQNPQMSPDGGMVLAGDRLFSSKTGEVLANYGSADGDYVAAFSPNNLMWGFSKDNSLISCLTTDRDATMYSTIYTDSPNYPAFKILYHPDGKRVASVFRYSGRGYSGVQMYDMDSELPVGLYRFEGETYDATLSDDGTMLLIGGDNNVRLFDVKTGRVLRYFYPMHSSMQSVKVKTVQFAKNDNLIMIAWNYNYVETYERTKAQSLAINPVARSLAPGQSQAFTVEVVNDDSTRRDVTPRAGEEPVVKLEIDPPSRATLVNNVVTVNAGAFGQFTVRAKYRENGRNYTAEALVTIQASKLVELTADPVKMSMNPGVYRPIRYFARFDDGYRTEVTPDATLTADRPEDVDILGQNVKIPFTAQPGEIVLTGTYTDSIGGAKASAETRLIAFGPKTAWERYKLTGGGYGLSGAYSPNGLQLAAGSSSGAINLYQVGVTPTQYVMRHVIMAHQGPVVYVGYLSNSAIVSVGDDGTIRTWNADAPSSAPLTTFRHDALINTADLLIAGAQKLLVIGDKLGRVGLFDLDAQKMSWLVQQHTGEVTSVALDGDSVISGSKDNRVWIYNRTTGAVLKNISAHTKPIVKVGYFGTDALYSLSQDRTMARWSKSKGDILERYEYNAEPTAAAVIGGQLYVATKDPILTWTYNTDGLLLRQLEHPPAEGYIVHYMVDPNGLLVTGRMTGKKIVKTQFMGMDVGEEEVTSPFSSFQFWETGRGIFRGSLAHSYPLSAAHVTDDGAKIFTQDAKRTMAWVFNGDTATTGSRMMETGYFIAPRFETMDFTADSSILATRVGSSIFMFDTVHNLLWKSLHTPGGPLAISPLGTRLATADSKVRLWDLANLSMIREESRSCASLDFKQEDNFVGAITADNSVGVWNNQGLLFHVIQTQNAPIKVQVNRAGDRLIVITQKIEGDDISQTISYFAEVYDISDLSKDSPLVSAIFLFTQEKESSFFGPSTGENIGFAIAISEDATLALVGPSGNRPVKLINMNDGSTIREFMPPTGDNDANIGAAALGFMAHDNGLMIGWAEGYAELWRRLTPQRLILNANTTAGASQLKMASSATKGSIRLATSLATAKAAVRPGQTLQMESLVAYGNGDELNVTQSSAFTSDYPAGVFIRGSLITISPTATPRAVTLTARYEEFGTELTAQIQLDIVGAPLDVSQLSQEGYAIDLLTPGKAVYGDQAFTFTNLIPSDCLNQIYIRTLNAHRDAVSNEQIRFRVNHPVTVIVALDNAITATPTWLAGWTLRPQALLGTTDPHADRRLYQKAFEPGEIVLGGNRNEGATPGNSMYTVIVIDRSAQGTLVVKVTPETAPWQLNGPGGIKLDDSGTTTIQGLQVGSYGVTWQPLAGWTLPGENPATRTLVRDGVTTITGVYTRLNGSVQVNVTPDGATWKLVDADGGIHEGSGDKTLAAIPTGTATITWNPLTGYDAPAPASQSGALGADETVAFTQLYVPQAAGDARTKVLILRYLLGLSTDATGLDLTGDGKVTVADLIKSTQTPADKPSGPNPADKAIQVAVDQNLDWADAKLAASYDVYLWKASATKPTTPTAGGLKTSLYDPPQNLAWATSYKWQVVARNSAGIATAGPEWTFATMPEKVLVVTPNGGETWTRGQSATVHWQANPQVAGSAMRVELWRGATKAAVLVASSSSATGDKTETIATVASTLAAGTNYKVRVISIQLEKAAAANAYDESNATFTIK